MEAATGTLLKKKNPLTFVLMLAFNFSLQSPPLQERKATQILVVR